MIRFQLTSYIAFQNTYYSENIPRWCIYKYILQRPTPLTKAAFQRLRNKKHPPKIFFPLKSCALSAFAFWFFSCSFSSRSLRSFNLTSWRHCCFWQNKLGEIEKTKKNKPQFIALYIYIYIVSFQRWNPRPWWLFVMMDVKLISYKQNLRFKLQLISILKTSSDGAWMRRNGMTDPMHRPFLAP